jgi:hypothetical protein
MNISCFDTSIGTFYVENRCPKCKKFLQTKDAKIKINGCDEVVEMKKFICKVHGQVEPDNCWWD